MEPRKGDALVVVDVQNDFAHPDGSLYVPGAETILSVVREWINSFVKEQQMVVVTKDWHPPDHISFGEWPIHCVQNTWGAEIPDVIPSWRANKYVWKGQEKDKDEYSGFAPDHGLKEFLNDNKVERIFIVGLAIDYCVKATVLDGLNNGFEAVVVSNGVAGVNVNPGDVRRAFEEMEEAGAVIL